MPGKRIERLQIMLNEEELAAIDEWRFQHRMASRSAAVRAMLNVAIRKGPAPPSGDLPYGEVTPSRDVGVLACPPVPGEAASQTQARPDRTTAGGGGTRGPAGTGRA